uniref:Uncharacterized protein n=1 Tax=Geospiza parvula TaxID=87175 RepID=A0A8C3M531_GEOPR
MLSVGCGLEPVLPIRVALGRLQQQRWSPGGCRRGPRRAGAVGGLSPPGDIRVAAHCGEVCDGRGAGEAHIWARSRLLEAAAPQPGDEAPDKGCSPRCCCCCVHWLGRRQRCPGRAGWGPVAMGPLLALGLRAAGSGELRLVGGGGRCAGRVEVKHDGEWGSVCVFDFDWEARWAWWCAGSWAAAGGQGAPARPFGQGSGRIWLQPFFCVGTEDALEHCPHFGWGQHFCGHEWDVGVTCTGEGTHAVELRLAGGGSPCAGRVEVKLQGHWGSVADDGWDMEDAEVVCQQLGCGSASAAYIARGAGDGLVSLALVDCRGDEAALGLRDPLFMPIPCRWPCTAPTGFSQLVGGDGACAGRLEVRQGRAWGGVCEDEVDMEAAQVVCRGAGLRRGDRHPRQWPFWGSVGMALGTGCLCGGAPRGRAAAALAASSAPVSGGDSGGSWGPRSISALKAVPVAAYTGFRLGNGSSGCSGRVEVAVRGTWGSVCASEWDLPDAHVLCRHVGCGRAFSVLPGGSFGSGEGPLRPDAFGCSGSERHPGQCPVAVLGKPPCAPGNAAAVNCSVSVKSLRLVKGETRCDGFLELNTVNGTWLRVPGEVSLLRNFSKVCWKLGCGELEKSHGVPGKFDLSQNKKKWNILIRVIATINQMTTAQDTTTISENYFGRDYALMTTAPADIPHGTYLVCSGAYPEKGRRWRCPKQPPQPSASVPTGSLQVRLVGSSGRCAGHVEVYSGGSWSWVCQEGWELQDAAVVCRELGCGTALQAPGWARSGAGTGPLWPYSPECSGPEESLWECGRTERRECGRGGGAGAVCSGQCRAAPDQGPAEAPGGSWPCRDPPAPLAEQLSVRLAGGPGRCRGFLEISYNGTWGRVCANGSSPSTAATVCRQLGCGHRGWLLPVPAQEPTEAWLAWVGCEDGARSLWQCPSAPWHLQSCGTDGHAHVECEEDSDGSTAGHTTPYPEGATSTGSSARARIPQSRLAGIPLASLPACVPTGVPRRRPPAVAVGPVPVPTVLCVVLGTLLCLSLGALALLLCRARRRGGSRWVRVGTDPVWGSRGPCPAEQLRRGPGVILVPPTVPSAAGKCCISFQALAELQMPSPTLSTRSWITKPCTSTRRRPLPQVGAALVPQLCPQ